MRLETNILPNAPPPLRYELQPDKPDNLPGPTAGPKQDTIVPHLFTNFVILGAGCSNDRLPSKIFVRRADASVRGLFHCNNCVVRVNSNIKMERISICLLHMVPVCLLKCGLELFDV